MNLVPVGDKVVVQRIDAQTTTAGGIVLPDTAQTRSQEGRVLSVGDGRLMKDGTRATSQVSEGDRVLFASYAGTELDIDGQHVVILSESDILAIVS